MENDEFGGLFSEQNLRSEFDLRVHRNLREVDLHPDLQIMFQKINIKRII